MKREALIVGIDPGLTTAYSALNFSGTLIALHSRKEFGLRALIAELTSLGRVVVIACDVVKVPEFVLKVAKQLRAKIFKPEKRIATNRKRALVKNFSKEMLEQAVNRHEIAALTAAILAYKRFAPTLNKIRGLKIYEEQKTKIFLGLIEGKYKNISDALRKLKIS